MKMMIVCKKWLPLFCPKLIKIRRACSGSIQLKMLPCDDTKHAGTMAEVHHKMMQRMNLEAGWHPIPKTREHLLKYMPKESALPARCMKDSLTSAIIPLSVDSALQDKYVDVMGRVRMGRLLEIMDLFAGWVCHQHVLLPELPQNIPLPYTFVTILVDKVHFSKYESSGLQDVRLTGHISWVGRSSMEVLVTVDQKNGANFENITHAVFLMAARDATNTGAAIVNPLAPANDEEKAILAGGEERKRRRTLVQQSSIFKMEPNDFEQTLMYQIYSNTTDLHTLELNKRFLPSNSRWMSDTVQVNTLAAFPENRNAHNRVFGGFLMRCAVEISWICATLYAKQRARLVDICDISFQKPVEVGSFLQLKPYVVYTEANYVQTMVVADVLGPNSANQMTTNTFYLTFELKDQVPKVLPRTYHESMWYILGRRKFKDVFGLE